MYFLNVSICFQRLSLLCAIQAALVSDLAISPGGSGRGGGGGGDGFDGEDMKRMLKKMESQSDELADVRSRCRQLEVMRAKSSQAGNTPPSSRDP